MSDSDVVLNDDVIKHLKSAVAAERSMFSALRRAALAVAGDMPHTENPAADVATVLAWYGDFFGSGKIRKPFKDCLFMARLASDEITFTPRANRGKAQEPTTLTGLSALGDDGAKPLGQDNMSKATTAWRDKLGIGNAPGQGAPTKAPQTPDGAEVRAQMSTFTGMLDFMLEPDNFESFQQMLAERGCSLIRESMAA